MTTTRCACGSYEFGIFDVDTDEDYTTECDRTTTNIFAQGHDAKLVGFMVRAELAGHEIRRGSIHYAGAVQAARTISEALAIKAQAQLDAARARLAKKELAEATKKAKRSARKEAKTEAAPAPTTREAKIKVGRWTYDAVIDLADGEAHFFSKQGKAKTAAQGTYTEEA